MSLMAKTVRGSAWTFGGAQLSSALAFAVSIVAARAMSPDDLGRYALVTTILALASSASTLQAGGYYIVTPNAGRRLLRSGVALELGLGGAMLVLVLVACALVAGVGDDPEFSGMLALGGVVLLTNPFNSVRCVFERELEYRPVVMTLVVATTVSALLKIGLVLAGLDAWGLVIGDVALSAIYGAMMLYRVPDARGVAVDRELFRPQLSFGLPALATAVLSQAVQRTPDIIVASVLGTRALGFYYLAARVPAQVFQLGGKFAGTLLPAFSRSTKEQLARGYGTTTKLSAFFMGLPLAIVIPLAPTLVEVVYGDGWEPAATPLTFLLLAISVRFVFWHAGNLLKSQGRVKEMMYLQALQLVLTIAACLVGSQLAGLDGVAGGMLAVELLLVPPKVRLIRSVVPFAPIRVLRAPLVAMLAGVGVALASALLLPSVAALLIATATVASVFALVVWRDEAETVVRIRSSFGRTA